MRKMMTKEESGEEGEEEVGAHWWHLTNSMWTLPRTEQY